MPQLPISPEAAIALGVLVAVAMVAAIVGALRAARRASPAAREAPARVEERPEPPPAAERMRGALAKTRDALRRRLGEILGANHELEAVLGSLEEVLLAADVGLPTTTRILATVRKRCGSEREPTDAKVREALRGSVEELLGEVEPKPRTSKPWVILVSGVNGVGKTTSIGKLAARFAAEGDRVMLVAADTFRAAAIDQLGIWAERVGADFVRHRSGADPAAVAFDGVKAAAARGIDVVIVDTAGRLHTRENLMEELRKVTRVIGKAISGAPHEVWLVLDATTGQNAIHQAKVFSSALGVTGLVITKLDGTAKGGAALAVRHELGVPIVWLGIGEGMSDIRPFSAAEFATALVGED